MFDRLEGFRGRNPVFGIDVVNGCLNSLRVLFQEEPKMLRTDFNFCTNTFIQRRRTPRRARQVISPMVAGGVQRVQVFCLLDAHNA